MADILYIRLSNLHVKRTLEVQAGLHGVSVNEFVNWLLEEAALPHDELVEALQARAEEVESRKRYSERMTLKGQDVPRPRAITQPMKRASNASRTLGLLDEMAMWEERQGL